MNYNIIILIFFYINGQNIYYWVVVYQKKLTVYLWNSYIKLGQLTNSFIWKLKCVNASENHSLMLPALTFYFEI